MKSKRRSNEAGFSLLEMLVAFIILGISSGPLIFVLGSSSLKLSTTMLKKIEILSAQSVMARVGKDILLKPGLQHGVIDGKISWSVKIVPNALSTTSAVDGSISKSHVQACFVEVQTSATSGRNQPAIVIHSVRLLPGLSE